MENTKNTQTSTTSAKSEYFDIKTTGVGYLNRLRSVTTAAGSYNACNIAVLSGHKDNVQYTYLDANLKSQADEILSTHFNAINEDDNAKVLIGFVAGGLKIGSYKSADGETKPKGSVNLLQVSFLKINGTTVYSKADEDAAKKAESEASMQDQVNVASGNA